MGKPALPGIIRRRFGPFRWDIDNAEHRRGLSSDRKIRVGSFRTTYLPATTSDPPRRSQIAYPTAAMAALGLPIN
eukprot:837804-Amorphochlora_amoeboformis.AAC.2